MVQISDALKRPWNPLEFPYSTPHSRSLQRRARHFETKLRAPDMRMGCLRNSRTAYRPSHLPKNALNLAADLRLEIRVSSHCQKESSALCSIGSQGSLPKW